MLAIVLECAVLTYGGVRLFVAVFVVHPFAAEIFKARDIPKWFIPGTIALGAFIFAMDSLPGTPQIQNIVLTAFFKTNIYAAPWLGLIGATFILIAGLTYLNWCRRRAAGEGYGTALLNEPALFEREKRPHPIIVLLPLVGKAAPVVQQVSSIALAWALEGALLISIATVLVFAWKRVAAKFTEGTKSAIGGALPAILNTRLGVWIWCHHRRVAGLYDRYRSPQTHPQFPGLHGGHFHRQCASGRRFFWSFHRVAAMASGGKDTLPHNGGVITLLAVIGLTHKQSYKDIFIITVKTLAVFAVIAVYYLMGIV